jgi:hypothetical protein
MMPLPYGLLGTPWKAGIIAFEAGDGLDANPYPDVPLADPDRYPRPWQGWREGWLHAKHMAEHTAKARPTE